MIWLQFGITGYQVDDGSYLSVGLNFDSPKMYDANVMFCFVDGDGNNGVAMSWNAPVSIL